MGEVNDLFGGWKDYPPTNILVKALVEGFGGGGKSQATAENIDNIPPEAFDAMQRSAIQAISAKAGTRIPVISGRDRGLPSKAPIFDVDEMRNRNAALKISIISGDDIGV